MFLTITNLTSDDLDVGYPVMRTLGPSGDPDDSVTVGISREDLLFGGDQGRPAFKELDMLVQTGKAVVTIDADADASSVMQQADRAPLGVAGTVVANSTALKAIASADRTDGDLVSLSSDRSLWRFSAASTAADTTENLVITPTVGTGRWLRADNDIHLKLAVGFATANNATLFTVPVGFRLQLPALFWETTVDWTGGTGSAVGVSSDQAPYSTAGDLLGGATGDVAADLQAADGVHQGTRGTAYTAQGQVVLEAGSKIRWNRITSAFLAGAGFVHVDVEVIS